MATLAELKKIFAASLLLATLNTYGMQENNTEDQQLQPKTQEMTMSVETSSSKIPALMKELNNIDTKSNTPIPSNSGRDYVPFLRSIGITDNMDKVVESCRLLESKYLTPEQIAQADMELLTFNKNSKKSVYDWVTSGWGLATWLVGTSKNFSFIAVVICSVMANIFQDKAVILATTSGAITSISALLATMYQYCKNKRLNRIAYNLVIMAGQASAKERRELSVKMEEGKVDEKIDQESSDSTQQESAF